MSLASDRDGPLARSATPGISPGGGSTLFDMIGDSSFNRFVGECAAVF
jgi:hypothetical protein